MKMSPIFPVKAIKKLLLIEYGNFKRELYSVSQFHIKQDYWGDAIYSIGVEIENCTSYEDLENFVSNHYRMSLIDWINSL